MLLLCCVSCCLARCVLILAVLQQALGFFMTVERQHRLLATLEVGYFERQQHQELQWCPVSQILASPAIITWLERGAQGHLDSHRVALVVRSTILHHPYQGVRV